MQASTESTTAQATLQNQPMWDGVGGHRGSRSYFGVEYSELLKEADTIRKPGFLCSHLLKSAWALH